MSKSTYREIPALLSARRPFEGRSMSARLEGQDYDVYTVYSYGTIIATKRPGRPTIFNDRKYSHTTSRHQNLVHAHL